MNSVPSTRYSMILRLPNAADVQAWTDFAETYEPFVYRFARRRGLQDADARELVQEVFLGVAKAVRNWQPDASRGKFRTWLFRIARNQLTNQISRLNRHAPFDSQFDLELDMATSDDDAASQWFQAEEQAYRQEIFRWASRQVESSVRPVTWQAFWRTSVLGESIDAVASDLGISRATVYVARSRVVDRLKTIVSRFESERLPS